LADFLTTMSHIVAPSGDASRNHRRTKHNAFDEAHDPTRARQASHFAAPSINPRGEFFHVFISYRVADDEELVKSLYSKIQLDSKNHAIPMLEYSKFPHQFHKDASNSADAAANVFVSARCLLEGEKWDWDKKKGGGFVGALLSSCVFVPVFSCSVDDQKPGHDPTRIGNIARMANLAQPSVKIDTWISMMPATQTSTAYLCFETRSHAHKHPTLFLEGGVVQFDHSPDSDLPSFLTKGKNYFLVNAKDGPRSHNKFQRFFVSESKGGPPLVLQACSSKFLTVTNPKPSKIDTMISKTAPRPLPLPPPPLLLPADPRPPQIPSPPRPRPHHQTSNNANLCFETRIRANEDPKFYSALSLEGGVVQFDASPDSDLPPFLTEGKDYFLVDAKENGLRSEWSQDKKVQRFLVSESKGGPPLLLQACSSNFQTVTNEPGDWVDNVLLELLLAKEMHEQTKRAEEGKCGVCLRRCMAILPVVLCDVTELSSFINTFISDAPSRSESLNRLSHATLSAWQINAVATSIVLFALAPPTHCISRNQREGRSNLERAWHHTF